MGLDGSNILVLKEHDVKVITDLMMGGDGSTDSLRKYHTIPSQNLSDTTA